jgi:hypothetical protein
VYLETDKNHRYPHFALSFRPSSTSYTAQDRQLYVKQFRTCQYQTTPFQDLGHAAMELASQQSNPPATTYVLGQRNRQRCRLFYEAPSAVASPSYASKICFKRTPGNYSHPPFRCEGVFRHRPLHSRYFQGTPKTPMNISYCKARQPINQSS